MKELEEYLKNDLAGVRRRFEEIGKTVAGISRLLTTTYHYKQEAGNPRGWPYALKGKQYDEPHFPKHRPSISTLAMCSESAKAILASGIYLDDETKAGLGKCSDDAIIYLWSYLKRRQKKTPIWKYNTFGENDPFTASWLSLLSAKRLSPPCTPEVRRCLKKVLPAPGADVEKSLTFRKDENEAGPHALPLLKVIQALPCLHTSGYEQFKEKAGNWLEKNLHRQMSFFRFEDYRFDAAELIFCLHGALLARAIKEPDPIIPKVLAIVREAQTRSVYWRPYRPMLLTPQGLVLLPLSIEVASSLLEVLMITNNYLEYQDTLAKYYNWMSSQRVEGPGWIGWHSENAYEADAVHLWQSAVIGRFLANFYCAEEKAIQESIMRFSGFTIKKPGEIDVVLKEGSFVPFDLGINNPDFLKELVTSFVDIPRKKYSILLYGPPGTAKTTAAEALAKSLNWPLVTLSPSDFIAEGPSDIEHRAKTIFDALYALKNTVIFFDEIDQMILDRESEAYGEQGDLFKFMTPGMLSKINKLRKDKQNIFIIGTNFGERIDKAIKREGRIDLNKLCLPYFREARKTLIKKFVNQQIAEAFRAVEIERLEIWSARDSRILGSLADKTYFNVYEELSRWVKDAASRIVAGDSLSAYRREFLGCLVASPKPFPQIELKSYRPRIIGNQYNQKPFEEYLTAMLVEAEVTKDNSLKREFKEVVEKWKAESINEYKEKEAKIKNIERRCHLRNWL